jgi:1-acyl-sn-glycerol-3-phosphate acyltransferase
VSTKRSKEPAPRARSPKKRTRAAPARARTRAKRGRPSEDNDDTPLSSDELELGIGSRVVPQSQDYETLDVELEPPRERAAGVDRDVEAQIRALEARLDGLIRGDVPEPPPPPSVRQSLGNAAQRVAQRLATPLPIELPGALEGGVGDAVKELLSSDYYLRQWGRLGMRHRAEEVDDFGHDPSYEARLLPLLDFLYRRWFRVETRGIEQIPDEGRCLLVANHSSTLPLDGVMMRRAVRLEHPRQRELRWLAEDFVYYLPFIGTFMNRVGAVRACQENAERLLKKQSLVAVFPEGVKGIGKLYRDRYRLQRFGRGGFIRLALRTKTPIVPAAIIGAEEANPMLYRVEAFGKAIGLPYFPVTPTFPALGLFGLVPAPTKWRIEFGEVMRFEGYGPEAADDHVLVGRLAERVRATIQRMVDEGLARRKSVWLG